MSMAYRRMSNSNKYSRSYSVSRLNLSHTEKTKKQMSISHSGKKQSQETIEKRISTTKINGYSHSIETKEKIRNSKIGKKQSPDVQKKVTETKRKNGTLPSGERNPSAVLIYIFNNEKELMHTCFGNFESLCKENGYPFGAFVKSLRQYINVYDSLTPQTLSKITKNSNDKYIGWRVSYTDTI